MIVTPEMLLSSYAQGLFPMAIDAGDPQLHWFDPPARGIFPVGGVHASRSLLRTLRQTRFRVTTNLDLSAVIQGCSDRAETWLNEPLTALYLRLHETGHCHSVELWEDETLVGGLFGVTLGSAFFGETMFSRRPNASKLALLWLDDHLLRSGFELFDTQYLTPHLASMGGQQVSRHEYRRRLRKAIAHEAQFGELPFPDAAELLQRLQRRSQPTTQIS